MGEVGSCSVVGSCPRLDMNEEYILRYLSEHGGGDSAASILQESIPDLEKIQLELLHLHLTFKTLENNWDVLLLENKFRDIIYQIQDAIDAYILGSRQGFPLLRKVFEFKARRNLIRTLKLLHLRLEYIAKPLGMCVTKKVVAHNHPPIEYLPHKYQSDLFVGRVQDLRQLKSNLVDFPSVSILGDGGVGKTWLARRLYSESRNQFQRVAWVDLSNRPDPATLFRELLSQLTEETKTKFESLDTFRVISRLEKIQLESTCLVVLDDLRSVDDWVPYRIIFGGKDTNSKLKLVVTTRIRVLAEHVALYALVEQNCGVVQHLKGFSEDESSELIAIKTYRTGIKSGSSEMLIAKEIATKCSHIPLAINLLGGHLARKHTLAEWSVLHENIVSGKWKREHGRNEMQQLIYLIILDLPVNLKHCLLYMAVFLGNSVIDTDKLYMLWNAEGLVQSRYGASTDTLIRTTDLYLKELASRGMVEVEKDEISKVKKFRSCRLKSMIHDMSLVIAKEENYLTIMDHEQSTSWPYKYLSIEKVRKIAAHLGGDKGGFSISFGHEKTDKLRSLLLLDTCPSRNNIFLAESLCMLKFKVLRVLHFDGLNFGAGKYLKQIEKLAFLRYLSFRNCYLENLPSTISKLLNLQTLDLRVREGCSMTIHNVLMKMRRMKHLYLPQLFRVHNDEKLRLDSLRELETLENFNSKLCCAQDLLQLINLRFLTASVHENRKDLQATVRCISTTSNYLCEASLDVGGISPLPCGHLSVTQNLFISNGLNTLHLDGHLGILSTIASSTLSVLIFTNSEFDQDPMPMLSKLPNLKDLVFNEHAFMGKQMVCPKMSFYKLRYLKLSTLPNLENLMIEEGTMPKLHSLTIEGCKNLKLHHTRLMSLKNLKQTKISGTTDAFQF